MATGVSPIQEERAPWTVLAYVPVVLLWSLAYRFTEGGEFPTIPILVGFSVQIAIGYGMFRRRKGALTIALILMVLPMLGLPGTFLRDGIGSGLLSLTGVVVVFYLLLHPATRAWCSDVRPPMERPGVRPPEVEAAVDEQSRRWQRH